MSLPHGSSVSGARVFFRVRFLLLCLLVGTLHSFAQDTLRIATYNLLNYPGSDASVRNAYFRAIIHTMKPDLLVVQEITSQAGVDNFQNNVLNAYQPGLYSSVPFNNGPDTDNSFFYKPSRAVFLGAAYITTSLRDIAEYRFKSINSTDTVYIYSLHLKAGSAPSDTLARLNEATTLRNHLNGLPANTKFIVAGDFNIYRSTESAFQKLIGSEVNNNGRAKDPLNAIGTWNNNFAFRFIHTQSTRTRSFGGGATGGLDDRFDMLLISYSMDPHLLSPTYTSYGNDGLHFNDSINRLPNLVVPDSVARALHYASDHLPVFGDFVFGGGGTGVSATSVNSGPWNTPATWNINAVPTGAHTVLINNGHTVTIDGTVACSVLTVNGILQFDGTDGRALTVSSTTTIATGGTLRASESFSTGGTTQQLTVGGDFVNDGTFSPRVTGGVGGTRVMDVVFNGAFPSTISGTASQTGFNKLRMNMASAAVTLTPLINLTLFQGGGGSFSLMRGTWVQSVAQTVTPSINDTVFADAVLSMSDGGSFSTNAASLIVFGTLNVAGGTLNVGNGNNRIEVLPGGSALFQGGTVNIAGRLALSGGTTTIEGGAIQVNPRGVSNLTGTSNVVEVAAAASLSMSDGSITLVNPKATTATGRELKVISGAGVKEFSGGTIFVGDGVSTVAGSDTGFVLESAVPLPHVVIRTGGVQGRHVSLASPLVVKSLQLESGTLRLGFPFAPGFDLGIAGGLRRTGGELQTAQRTVSLLAPDPLQGTSMTGEFRGAGGFHHLVFNNPAGTAVGGDIDVNGGLQVVAGAVATGVQTIYLGSGATLTENPGNPIAGRVSTTRMVTSGVNNTFGGVGMEVNAAGASPGITTVLRTTGTPAAGNGYLSIRRFFDLTPSVNTGLNATMRFRYDDTELNGHDPQTLELWRSTDTGVTWSGEGGSVNPSLRVIELAGISSLSRWTAADTAHPLAGTGMTVPVTVQSGWNILSNPLTVPNDSVRRLYPNSSFPYAFAYSSGYVQTYRMLNGTGYWMKFPAGETVPILGTARTVDSVDVSPGWNIIGSVSFAIDTSAVVTIPPGIRTSSFYGYEGGYVSAGTLIPGKGYWVKVNAAGRMILSSSQSSAQSPPRKDLHP